MAGPGDETGEAALWARWRALAAASGAGRAPEPDALLLAAYAEGRLDEAAAAAVEDWLAEEPERLADVAAARAAADAPPAVAPDGSWRAPRPWSGQPILKLSHSATRSSVR